MISRRLAGVVLACAIVGCGRAGTTSGGQCADIGCSSLITVLVDQPGERPLEACVGDACSPPGNDALSLSGVEIRDVVEVVVRVAGGGDEVARTTVPSRRTRPNGEGCPPECTTVPRLRLTVDDELVLA